jgi:hypothetical protein
MILSSSPPESAHVAAGELSRQLCIPHVVDLRDGWLDEPLKPILRNSRVRRWLEGRLEKALLGSAASIFVTSDVWRELLCERMPLLTPKVTVLTNGYPRELERAAERPARPVSAGKGLELVHAGQFSGSRSSQHPNLLLQPLLDGIRQSVTRGAIRLVGSLTQTDRDCVKRFEGPFEDIGWTIECRQPIPRRELLDTLVASDGLLLLSASKAAIPSKLFEYIAARRPILAITVRDGATWRLCERLPSAFQVALDGGGRTDTVAAFLSASGTEEVDYAYPQEHSESYLREIARTAFRRITIS